jgi:hypothetical protein
LERGFVMIEEEKKFIEKQDFFEKDSSFDFISF